MSDLVVMVYPTEAEAEDMRSKLAALQEKYVIELGDAVIAVKQQNGKIELKQLLDTTETGAWRGGYWCRLIGMMFLMPPLGSAIGEASCRALGDYGISGNFMAQLAEIMQPGYSALFVEFQEKAEENVLQALKGTGGTMLKASLHPTKERALRNAIAAEAAGMTPAPATYS